MGVYFIIAYRNLVQAKRRTFFLSAALGLVTMLLVLLLSLSQGLTETMIRAATTLSAGHVNVSGFYKVSTGDASPIITGAAEIKRIAAENAPDLDYVIDRHRGWARVVSDTGSINVGLNGVDVAEEGRFLEVIELAKEKDYKEGGREEILGDMKRLGEPGTALIFVNQAKRLGLGVGDQLTITIETLHGTRNTGEATIVAVAKDVGFMSNWSIFVTKQLILDLYQLQKDTSGAVMVYLKHPERAEATMAVLRKVFEDKGYRLMEHEPKPFFFKFETVAGEDWTGQKLDLTTWRDEVSYLTWVLTALDSISFMLIGILLVIIVVGIMNAMWIAVRERTGEVGTLRAIGMMRERVLGMFMVEAVMLGVFATAVGGAVGASIAGVIDAAHLTVPVDAVRVILMSDTLHLSVKVGQVAAAVGVFTLVTALSALWPAIRAARMQPVTAIHHIN